MAAAFVFAIASYMLIAKYEIYFSGGDGTIVYRFNKITGSFESNTTGKWKKDTVLEFGIRQPGTFKAKSPPAGIET